MYFQGNINKVFCYLDEETRNSIIELAKRDGEAILYYNSALNVLNVTNNDDCKNLSEIVLIAKIAEKDLEFADTNREEVNKMNNAELAAFMVGMVLEDKVSLTNYLEQRSELSTYNLAKITRVEIDSQGLELYTSEVAVNSLTSQDVIQLAPINGKSYKAIVVNKVAGLYTDKESLILRLFEDTDGIPISIIPKLIGTKIKVAPKNINNTGSNIADFGTIEVVDNTKVSCINGK